MWRNQGTSRGLPRSPRGDLDQPAPRPPRKPHPAWTRPAHLPKAAFAQHHEEVEVRELHSVQVVGRLSPVLGGTDDFVAGRAKLGFLNNNTHVKTVSHFLRDKSDRKLTKLGAGAGWAVGGETGEERKRGLEMSIPTVIAALTPRATFTKEREAALTHTRNSLYL